jgi:RNA polymerase sigma-70 factor (ECF subfamily)
MDDTASLGQPGTMVDDATLLARMQAGDGDAFELFVRSYTCGMLLAARRILGNEEDACDAVQDAFLSAFKGIGRFEGLSRLSTWLHRIVVNAALSRQPAGGRTGRVRKTPGRVSLVYRLPG